MSTSSSFAAAWSRLEADGPRPTRARRVLVRDWDGLEDAVRRGSESFADRICSSLYAGDCYILQGAFARSFMSHLQKKAMTFFREEPSSFHKMTQSPLTPDFHKIITAEEGAKYSFPLVKHAAYYFPWNSARDADSIWGPVWERWRVIKKLMGFDEMEYEKNTPKDGVVDRIQIAHYPPQIGYLAPHSDPFRHQRLFLSAYMSKRGVDYHGGGFYVVSHGDSDGEHGGDYARYCEDEIEVGDIGIGYATVVHGVAPCSGEGGWDSAAGRWFLGLYSNVSDEVKDRHTGEPVRLALPGVTP